VNLYGPTAITLLRGGSQPEAFDALPPLQTLPESKLPKIDAFESEVGAKLGAKFG
jgi:hypothetical protein